MKDRLTIGVILTTPLFLFSSCVTARYGKVSYIEISPEGIEAAPSAIALRSRCEDWATAEEMYTEAGKSLKEANMKGMKNFKIAMRQHGESTAHQCVTLIGEKL